MSAEDNKALVRRYYEEVLTQGNLALLDELFTPAFVSRGPTGPEAGLEAFRQAVLRSRAAFPDLQVRVEDQVAEGEKVASRWMVRGTHRGAFAGVPPTGRQVTATAIHIHRVADGRIAELWEQFDLLGLLQQLGVVPGPGKGTS